jgi:uncharacterized protein YjiS (DUF1127 family)
MNSIPFAPRTIARARRVRSRFLARQFRRFRRNTATTMSNYCTAIAEAWRRQQQLMDMTRFDDHLLRDIGVTRSEVQMAAHDQRWTHAAWRLMTTAIARRRKRRAAEARIRLAAQALLQQRPSVAPRPNANERSAAAPRLAA